ncbi:FeoA family protein [Streptomyces indicus]|uniref:Ferrous iron transport protein A n=1 Tax=Streptomyces indicus TaxID=417292 RepID=A0A1G9A6R2_9ACTN|nr:FeoA family protein [Streptomyces indicus]SDK23036.1 ferrous iron transport protein A [Streptomyces indicus]
MTLRGCAPGTHARIRRITTDAPDRLRLAELGFVRGALVRVVGRGATGGLLLALGDARVAVDDETAQALQIERIERIEEHGHHRQSGRHVQVAAVSRD